MRPTFQCLCGCYLAVWPSAIHFTSLSLRCPNLKNDGGGVSVICESLPISLLFPRFFVVCDLKELETRGPALHTSVAIDWQEVGLLGSMLMV